MKKIMKQFGKWDYFEKWNVLYAWKCLLSKKVWRQWIYMITPFILTMLVFVLMECDGVLIMGEKEFSFVMDSSNSFCMVILLALSYYLLPLYSKWVKDAIEALKKYQNNFKMEERINKLTKWLHGSMVVAFIGASLGIPFAVVAREQGVGWMSNISLFTNIVYSLYLSLVWYFSLCLLSYVLVGCYLIKTILAADRIELFKKGYQVAKHDLEKVSKCLSITISYSTFWVVGAIIMIINDTLNYKQFGINLTFHKYPIVSMIVIFVVVIAIIYVMLPAMEYNKVIRQQKNDEIKRILESKETEGQKRTNVAYVSEISESVFDTLKSKITLVFSMFLPTLASVLQVVLDFVMKD